MIWLVCGGRDFTDIKLMYRVMRQLVAEHGEPSMVITGAAPGADTFAENWAREMTIPYVGVPAKWQLHGRAAGPMRNQKMLDDHKIDLVVVFPGGRGTRNMRSLAMAAGIRVFDAK